MDERKRRLIGSPKRDAFKHWHKKKCRGCYASDLDFVLVKKTQRGKENETIKASAVVAVLDYKAGGERITFAEIIIYNDILTRWKVPVYIIEANVELEQCPVCESSFADMEKSFTQFTVQRYLGGDWRPMPEQYELETIFADGDEETYWAWEQALRDSMDVEDFQELDVEHMDDPFDIERHQQFRDFAANYNT